MAGVGKHHHHPGRGAHQVQATPAEKGMRGAVEAADALAKEHKNSFIPGQFDNRANPDAHRRTTALEILEDMDADIYIFGDHPLQF